MNIDTTIVIEELGVYYNSDLSVAVEFEGTEYEPAVYYLPNGDPGYPEVPASFDLIGLRVESYTSMYPRRTIKRSERPDWFEVLDKIATKYVEDHIDDYCEELTYSE